MTINNLLKIPLLIFGSNFGHRKTNKTRSKMKQSQVKSKRRKNTSSESMNTLKALCSPLFSSDLFRSYTKIPLIATAIMTKTGEAHPKDIETVLKNLGVKHPNQATRVLENLLEQNIITPADIKFVLSPNNRSKHRYANDNAVILNRYMTRHIALRFHYDGATYNGLAQNVNSPIDNTVEKLLFAAMTKTCLIDSRDTCGYSRSGRTDKGVSAFGQVVALRVRSVFPIGTFVEPQGDDDDSSNSSGNERTLLQEMNLPKNHLQQMKCWVPPRPKQKKGKAGKSGSENGTEIQELVEKVLTERDFAQILNNVLPHNIRVLGWSPVTDDFSARFSTKSRTYRYFFVRRDLDLDAMSRGLEYMVGTHDFRNLCKMNCEEVDNFERVVTYGKIVKAKTMSASEGSLYEDHIIPSMEEGGDDDDSSTHSADLNRQVCYFEIKGQAFLWHQIRCIASVLFMIGKKVEKPEVVNDLFDIETNPGKPCYTFAPDVPLVLHKCEYHNLRFGHSVQNLWKSSVDLECKWEELALAAERLKNGVASLREEAEVHMDDVVEFVEAILDERSKKQSKRQEIFGSSQDIILPEPSNVQDGIMKWNAALDFIFKHTGCSPTVGGPTVQVHVPLMQRGRGTTYEEKVLAILADPDEEKGSMKRKRGAYENNIKKKKVSKEENKAFYTRMAMQGGSGL